VKKPLMTKVSMRHLNELVRERNQYSRDALEAWQDFINLKGRMDTELSKVTKRNNFLVEELESWKQQVNPNLIVSGTSLTNLPSFLNSKLSRNNLQKRLKILRSKLRTTNARIVALLLLSISKRTTLRVSRFVSPAQRSSATTPWRLLSFSKKSPKNLSVRESATRRTLLLSSILSLRLLDRETSRSVWFCTCAA
jgi:hypothetical protein